MATYDGTINVNADMDQVWNLVARANNFPRYFPNARARQAQEQAQQADRLLFEWTVGGKTIEERLWFKQLPEEHRFEWGSENPADDFHGYVDLHKLDARMTEVDMHLDAPQVGPSEVRQTVQQALDQIKQTAESGGR